MTGLQREHVHEGTVELDVPRFIPRLAMLVAGCALAWILIDLLFENSRKLTSIEYSAISIARSLSHMEHDAAHKRWLQDQAEASTDKVTESDEDKVL